MKYHEYVLLRSLYSGMINYAEISEYISAYMKEDPPKCDDMPWKHLKYSDKWIRVIKHTLKTMERDGYVQNLDDWWVLTEIGLDVIGVMEASGGYTDIISRMDNTRFEILKILYMRHVNSPDDPWMWYRDIERATPLTVTASVRKVLDYIAKSGGIEREHRYTDKSPFYTSPFFRIVETGIRAFLIEHKKRGIIDLEMPDAKAI